MIEKFAKGWYAILHIDEITVKPLGIKRFGLDLVVWRDLDNQVVVMEDRCPHRSAKLSIGYICNGNITCPFHGFQFGSDSDCKLAPEFNKAIPRLRVNKYKSQVKIGMLWVYLGEDEQNLLIDPLIEVHELFSGKYSVVRKNWRSNITRCIENQLDYTHLPEVHKTTIGRNFKMPENPRFIQDGNNILSLQHDEHDIPSSIYVYPNSWILNIGNRIKLIVYFVPISAEETRFYIFAYRKFLTNALIKPLMDFVMNYSNMVILKQDQSVVLSQGSGFSYAAEGELLMRHDGAIRLFREIWKDNL